VIDALEEWPASATAADRAALYLLNDTERLDNLLRRTSPVRADRRGTRSDRAAGRGSSGVIGHTHDSRAVVPASRAFRAGTSRHRNRRTAVLAGGPRGHRHRKRRPPCRRDNSRVDGELTRGRDAVRSRYIPSRAARPWPGPHPREHDVAFGAPAGRRPPRRRAGPAVAVAFAIIEAAGTNTSAHAALTPVVIFAAIYTSNAIGFPAGQAAFTVAVIVLFSLWRRRAGASGSSGSKTSRRER